MYGTDVERVLLTVCKIKDLAADKLAELGTKSMYRMETIPHSHNVHVVINGGPHGHPTGAHSHDHWYTGHSPTGGTGMTGHVSDQLTYPQDYSDDMNPDHPHTQSSIIYEQEHEEVSMQFVSELLLMKDQLKEDAGRMDSISQDMYTDANTFNNTYGSPFQEIKNLMNIGRYQNVYRSIGNFTMAKPKACIDEPTQCCCVLCRRSKMCIDDQS